MAIPSLRHFLGSKPGVGLGWLLGTLLSSPLACHPKVSESSTGAASQPAPLTLGTAIGQKWPEFDHVATWPAVNHLAFISNGHAPGRYTAEVKVSPAEALRYRNLVHDTTFPVTTIVASFHTARLTESPGPIHVMQKVTADSWEFLLLAPSGEIVLRERTGLCQRCHAEALSDHLFGAPRGAGQTAPPAPTDIIDAGQADAEYPVPLGR